MIFSTLFAFLGLVYFVTVSSTVFPSVTEDELMDIRVFHKAATRLTLNPSSLSPETIVALKNVVNDPERAAELEEKLDAFFQAHKDKLETDFVGGLQDSIDLMKESGASDQLLQNPQFAMVEQMIQNPMMAQLLNNMGSQLMEQMGDMMPQVEVAVIRDAIDNLEKTGSTGINEMTKEEQEPETSSRIFPSEGGKVSTVKEMNQATSNFVRDVVPQCVLLPVVQERLAELRQFLTDNGECTEFKGATTEEIEKIPCSAVQQEDIDSEHNICGICRAIYQLEDMVRTLPCGHKFHKQEIDQWLSQNKDCPYCRKSIINEDPQLHMPDVD